MILTTGCIAQILTKLIIPYSIFCSWRSIQGHSRVTLGSLWGSQDPNRRGSSRGPMTPILGGPVHIPIRSITPSMGHIRPLQRPPQPFSILTGSLQGHSRVTLRVTLNHFFVDLSCRAEFSLSDLHILGIFIPMHLQDILQSLEKNSQD